MEVTLDITDDVGLIRFQYRHYGTQGIFSGATKGV